jgi:hypothetical protein
LSRNLKQFQRLRVAPEPVAEVVEPPMVAESAIEMETLEVEAAVELVEAGR